MCTGVAKSLCAAIRVRDSKIVDKGGVLEKQRTKEKAAARGVR